jgi:acyl transferase domain-containing protein
MSIVVGANLILDPCFMVSMSNMGYFSDDGRCFSFDARGNGYGRGEGMAAVVVKPLHQALADGDPIRAVIRNTHVNQDGRTPGITLPSQQAQATMIREAYAQAGLDMEDTAYFESHGTGTPAGDPIEAAAIGSTLGAARYPGEKLYVGTAKSNLGHTEACASVAGLIKVAMSLENATIVPNYDFQTPNPDIPFQGYKLVVPTEVMPWPSKGVRRASINAFGYGGTNAHAIVESFESFMRNNIRPALTPPLEKQIAGLGRSEHLLVVSAKTSTALQSRLEALAGYLQSSDTLKLGSLAYTLAERRSHMSKRAFVIASSIDDAVQQLKKPITLPNPTSSTEKAQIAFCFTGQGAQWAGMGLCLIDQFLIARITFDRCAKVIRELGASWDPIEELRRSSEDSIISKAELSQPLCTALQITLVDLLRSTGVLPGAGVFGHSSGEIAAAYGAGLLSLEDAMTASYFRGLWCSKLSELAPSAEGAMIAVGLSEVEFEPYLASLKLAGLKASVACVNSPSSITVSGDKAAIKQVKMWMDEAGTFARELRVDTAYHSHHMLHVAEQYRESMAKIAPSAAAMIPFFSSVHGKELGRVPVGADYWVTNMVSQVKFLQAVEAFAQARSTQEAETIVIEIGPHSALAGPLKEILRQPELSASSISYLPSLVRKQPGSTSFLTLLGQLYLRRIDVDFSVASTGTEQVLHDLPKYNWDRSTRYWQESRLSSDYRLREEPRHQLLGIRSADFNPFEPSWRLILRPNEQPWLRGHTVHGQILYPAGGFLATALQACKEYADLHLAERGAPSQYELKDVEICETLLIPEGHEGVEMQTILRKPRRSGSSTNAVQLEFTIYSCTNDKTWSENCFGTAVIDFEPVSQVARDAVHKTLTTSQRRLGHRILSQDVPEFYRRLTRIGYEFQAPFQNLTRVFADQGQAVASIILPDTAAHMPKGFELPQIIHAATADSLVSSAFPALFNNGLQACLVPTHIDSLTISASTKHVSGDELHVVATLVSAEQRTSCANVFAAGGETIVQIVGLKYTALPGVKGNLLAEPTSIVHKIVSEPDPAHLTSEVLRKLTPPRDAASNYDSIHVQLFDEACYRFAAKALGELQDWSPTDKTPEYMTKLITYLKGQVGR